MKNKSKLLCEIVGIEPNIDFLDPENFVNLQYLKIELPNWLGCRNMIDFAARGTCPSEFINHICCNLMNTDFGGKYGAGIREMAKRAIKNKKWKQKEKELKK